MGVVGQIEGGDRDGPAERKHAHLLGRKAQICDGRVADLGAELERFDRRAEQDQEGLARAVRQAVGGQIAGKHGLEVVDEVRCQLVGGGVHPEQLDLDRFPGAEGDPKNRIAAQAAEQLGQVGPGERQLVVEPDRDAAVVTDEFRERFGPVEQATGRRVAQ